MGEVLWNIKKRYQFY